MRYFIILSLFLVFNNTCFSQRKADVGLFGGTTYYLGDLNPNLLFSNPRYSVGPIFRYNFNSRYSLRSHIIYAKVAGTDIESNQFITKRNYPVSFTSNLVNAAAQFEFNFFNYETYEKPGMWTPYVFGGIGYSFLVSSDVSNSLITPENHVTIPFGIGAKLNLTRRMSAGVEWSNHKTFTSRIDGVISPVGETKLYSNDWYSFFGLFITYKFFKFAADCPVYD